MITLLIAATMTLAPITSAAPHAFGIHDDMDERTVATCEVLREAYANPDIACVQLPARGNKLDVEIYTNIHPSLAVADVTGYLGELDPITAPRVGSQSVADLPEGAWGGNYGDTYEPYTAAQAAS